MKKVLVLVFVIGFLLGTIAAADVCEEISFDGIEFTEDTPEPLGDPAPCGGGNGGGGGSPG